LLTFKKSNFTFVPMISYENSLACAQSFDSQDPLKQYRSRLFIPQKNGKDLIYLCGNSLGLQPKKVKEFIDIELKDWQDLGVEGHFEGTNPWMPYHKAFEGPVSRLVGALPHEVVVMNTLTVNLHLMMISFYNPTAKRHKILIEGGAFPSDFYAVESHIKNHGYNPHDSLIELKPRAREYTMRTEDIIELIKTEGESIALVMLGGVNYYTGQAFDMEAITKAGHEAGCRVGFDLAHAAGNLNLKLHDWNVDFAVWCGYKYLNSGPGGVSGAFVHEKWANSPELPRLAGWWGYDEATRFKMDISKGFQPAYGAAGWQLSNAQILPMAAHKASLEIFDEVGMDALRTKSDLLTGFLDFLIRDNMKKQKEVNFTIITPENPKERGAQISILALKNGKELFNKITARHIIADWREPNVIRVAPVPLYNTFEEVYKFVEVLFEG
jgi:kynureninase